ncbi:MAG: helix-turn-helix transcriptional regulator [Clostridia bacterium]|nr:helix-turn-helix transcriptional regulator [Clostridia bacterium]
MRHLEYLERRQRGTESFPVELYKVYPDSEFYQMPCHWHHEYEIIIVRQGRLSMILDERRCEASAGELVLLPGGTLHTGVPEDCVYDCIVFSQAIVDLKQGAVGGIHRLMNRTLKDNIVSSACSSELYRICLAMVECLEHRAERVRRGIATVAEEMICYGLLCQFFGTALAEGRFSSDENDGKRHTKQLKSVIAYMENNYQRDLSLAELAEKAGLSAKYLCRMFSALTGRSPIEYLNEYRVECACVLLAATDRQILDVAYSCGFNDQSYFIKMFKRYKGVTPGVYRKRF